MAYPNPYDQPHQAPYQYQPQGGHPPGYPPYNQQPGPYPPFQGYQPHGYPPQGAPGQGMPPQQHPQYNMPPNPPPFPPQQAPGQQWPQAVYPPQHTAGQYPPQAYNNYPPQAPAPVPLSLGYDPFQKAPGDASREADALRKAMKGWGTDEAALISVLTKPDPLQMALIRHTYTERIGRNLEKDLRSETSGSFEDVLVSLALGPLGSDVTHLRKSLAGMGTNEKLLDDILIGRSNADLNAIKKAYTDKYQKSLTDDIKGDLSGKTERFFVMLLDARRPENSAYFDSQSVDADVRELHRAMEGQVGTDEVAVSAVFLGASDAKLCAISRVYEERYHIGLDKVLDKEFSGHLHNALVSILRRARDPFQYDVEMLASCCTESSCDTDRLIYWMVRLHWDPMRFQAVKQALMQQRRLNCGTVLKKFYTGDFLKTMLSLWEQR
ncbi:hypothetical protein EYZ11_005651 [Aspergillus tanneri]|uniref:Annexin n=1 Tax=Aspergillus tanneri TaxID=1220188 RepID=A0A4S3JHG9_9EURO|nr:uncharacterized protein ATNIH1004_005275 [Aspergillus tanneri]KAA8649374.1 hypothetical protein ATNIH1004_005275 [Aspergillus tanneri]THC94889.1 hypothetical protein EYZ11_005651 [Aspergillus tanneri]